ncbi:MAG: diaminopimelate epimerase [Pyrinomonadaceae bacterium]|nr:diaminopimelate epimerase [Pyrinomonadaceae bacterium]
MVLIAFSKFHGFGNDYIVVEDERLSGVLDVSELARRICERNTGAGADGIAIIKKINGSEADYSCRIVNPDGSEAGFSGNGTRCAVAYLYYKDLWSDRNLRLETKSGIKLYEFLTQDQNTFWFSAELGKPNFDLPKSPVFEAEFGGKSYTPGIITKSLWDEDEFVSFLYVNVGNPVVCLFVEENADFDQFDWRRTGAEIESFTDAFPERTNVVFIKILDRENIQIRIWERGAGETSSSGTCSIAAAVASVFIGKTDRKVSVHAEGGTTEAVWREDDEMMITGRADLVFCGEWLS